MVRTGAWWTMLVVAVLTASASAQDAGSIRGTVYDEDFDVPLALAKVQIVETGQTVTGTEDGNYVFPEVAPGTYTLIFSKPGYARLVKPDVVVSAGQLAEVDASVSGDFTEMEEFTVEEVQIGAGTEAELLKLRFDSPALLDSVSAELMSRAGASDAAAALTLVTGASVQDGKFAVVRGLPDRFVNTQLNGVRLPTADEDKRAVELDQFPAAAIESIQVSKTFTPDQQGDASGGAVNIITKGIPREGILSIKGEVKWNTQVGGRDDFLTYTGGGVSYNGRRDAPIPPLMFDDADMSFRDFTGAVGVSERVAPIDFKFSGAVGGSHEFDNGIVVGGFASLFYEHETDYFDNGQDNSLEQRNPGDPLTPVTIQGAPGPGFDPTGESFKTALFDVTQGTELVQWGTLVSAGIENENNSVGITYLYTRTAEDTATLAEDTRGKEYFFPDYDPEDPDNVGNSIDPDNRFAAPYIRTETLDYLERTTSSVILNGHHRLPFDEFGVDGLLTFTNPEFDWFYASSEATLHEPDKRQFGTLWRPPANHPVFGLIPSAHLPYKPDAQFTLGNLQRIYKDIEELSDQYAVNLKLPFEQWTGDEGYLKFGYFDDRVDRSFDQESFSNFGAAGISYIGDFDEFWSAVFPFEDHVIRDSLQDVDYEGEQHIAAWYAMADMPIVTGVNVIGGARFERTSLSIVNFPEEQATWFPPDERGPFRLEEGDADVAIDQDDVLPSIGFRVEPLDWVTLRGNYSETIARPTFKELTPVLQQEFLGGPIFIGNPELQLAALQNYDLRIDLTPVEGSLISVSWFRKIVDGPIENVQKVTTFKFTTAENFPEGRLNGWEFEVRQDMGQIVGALAGLSLGANATLIDSEVDLPEEEIEALARPSIGAPQTTRDMTNAPEYLYNLYLTYDVAATGTLVGLFYTVRGDTLIAGAGHTDNAFVPSLYASDFDTLNLTIAQKLGEHVTVEFKAKNLTNPEIKTVYRSVYIGDDVTATTFTKGVEYSIGVNAQFQF